LRWISLVVTAVTCLFSHGWVGLIAMSTYSLGIISLNLLGPRDYCIGSYFWKFYLIRTSFTLGELVSLVKLFRLFRLERIFFGVQSVDTVGRCTTSYWQGQRVCDALLHHSCLRTAVMGHMQGWVQGSHGTYGRNKISIESILLPAIYRKHCLQ